MRALLGLTVFVLFGCRLLEGGLLFLEEKTEGEWLQGSRGVRGLGAGRGA